VIPIWLAVGVWCPIAMLLGAMVMAWVLNPRDDETEEEP